MPARKGAIDITGCIDNSASDYVLWGVYASVVEHNRVAGHAVESLFESGSARSTSVDSPPLQEVVMTAKILQFPKRRATGSWERDMKHPARSMDELPPVVHTAEFDSYMLQLLLAGIPASTSEVTEIPVDQID